jgi:hypothetical protein
MINVPLLLLFPIGSRDKYVVDNNVPTVVMSNGSSKNIKSQQEAIELLGIKATV